MAVFNVKNNQVWPDQYPKQSFLWFSLAPLKLPSLWANAKFALALQKVKKHHNSICKFHFYTHCSSSTMRGSSFARLSFLRPPLFVHSASPFYYFFRKPVTMWEKSFLESHLNLHNLFLNFIVSSKIEHTYFGNINQHLWRACVVGGATIKPNF